ncbi:hypothetical protein [uncultured Algibacter sp.]|uniref:hypothetical protein n=1 Tax=uncultured Algibacter sp. TaxID=298659 RepID=UPI003216B1C6
MKLIESIQILTRFAKQIGNRAELIIDFISGEFGSSISHKQETLINSIVSMTIIDSVSFIDEYNEVLGVKTEIEYKDQIKILKLINKPLLSQINKWKDLKSMRNHFLAHNLRQGKNGEFVLRNQHIDYNAPRTLFDLLLLSNLVQFTTENINNEFKIELKIHQHKTPPTISNINGLSDKSEVSRITIEVLKKSNELKAKHGRTYQFSSKKIVWNEI